MRETCRTHVIRACTAGARRAGSLRTSDNRSAAVRLDVHRNDPTSRLPIGHLTAET
jgi:hypothetical protein